MDKTFEVYKITNTENNKIYIGVTSMGSGARFRLHCWKANEGSTYPLHQAIREFGKEAFNITIIDIQTNSTIAREKEKYFIKLFDSQNPNIGYNTTAGGEYFEVTEEMKQAMSKAQKGRRHTETMKPVLQYTKDGEFIREFENMGDASEITGVSRAAMRRVISKIVTKPSKTNPYIWVLKSDYPDIPKFIHPKEIFTNLDYKPKMSDKCKAISAAYRNNGGDFSKIAKSVIKCDLDGNELERYDSLEKAAKANGITSATIRNHINGKYDYTNEKVRRRLTNIWKLTN